jgi:hypothetical protein
MCRKPIENIDNKIINKIKQNEKQYQEEIETQELQDTLRLVDQLLRDSEFNPSTMAYLILLQQFINDEFGEDFDDEEFDDFISYEIVPLQPASPSESKKKKEVKKKEVKKKKKVKKEKQEKAKFIYTEPRGNFLYID